MTRDDLPVLPTGPGCYLFQGSEGPVYVGKAKNLRSRVASYFGETGTGKARWITATAQHLDFIVTQSEEEALVLEASLIKRHKPRFNVLLKDDKAYPFLKLTREPFPRLVFTRSRTDDGGEYFGPYPGAGAVKKVQDVVNKTFGLRVHSGTPLKPRRKPCLRHHMGQCLAPCVGEADPDEYAERVRQARAFLDGRVDEVLERLDAEMKDAAARLDFERAAKVRDRAEAIRRVTGYDASVARAPGVDLDFLGFATAGKYAAVQIFQMRGGRVVGREARFLVNAEAADDAEILERVLADHYGQVARIPPLVLLPSDAVDLDTWARFLRDRAGRGVEVRVPKRGEKLELVGMANRNARTAIDAELARLERRGDAPGAKELQAQLALDEPPARIEGYDVSNLMGRHTVASIVAFEGGRPVKADYRTMKIRGLDKPDDFASMHQVLVRRFTGRLAESLPEPDLLLIDGGKGQVSSARAALAEAGVEVPIVGLAKREETLITQEGRAIHLPLTHPALRLLVHVRDEAHRVAVGSNRKGRGRAATRSLLDDVPGIGPKRRDALLAHFASVDEMRAADRATLRAVPGVGAAAADALHAFFHDPEGEAAPTSGPEAPPEGADAAPEVGP